jgi:hypothetical protein
MPRIKPPRRRIVGSYIYADPQSLLLDKPRRHCLQQLIRDPLPATRFADIDPLQLAVIAEPLCSMSRDEASDGAALDRNECGA